MQMKRKRREVTIKREIFIKTVKQSYSFRNLQQQDFVEQFPEQTRSRSCYCSEFGYMSKFQIRFHNIMPDYKTKKNTFDLQISENKRRQTLDASLAEKFRKGVLDVNKCKTMVQHFSMKKSAHLDFQKIVQQLQSPKHFDKKQRRLSCYCSECGKNSEFQQKHQDDPYFDIFNKYVKQKNQKHKNKYQNKLKAHTNQNPRKSYIKENKSPLSKYKSVSRTTRLLLEQSQIKMQSFSQRYSAYPSQRIKTEPTQSSPRSFKIQVIKTPIHRMRMNATQSVYKSVTTLLPKESFRTLASIYK